MGGWDFAHAALKILVTSGFGMPLVFGGLFIAWSWVMFGRMDSVEIKEVLMELLESRFIAMAGWAVAIMVTGGAWQVIKFLRRIYERQLDELRKTIDRLEKTTPSELPLSPSQLSHKP